MLPPSLKSNFSHGLKGCLITVCREDLFIRTLPSAGFNFILAISILGSSIENAKSSNSLEGRRSDFNTPAKY